MLWSTDQLYVFHLTVWKWKSGMGYCLINTHDIEPRIYFCNWKYFVWKYFVTFWSVTRVRTSFEILATKSDKRQEGSQKLKNIWFSVNVLNSSLQETKKKKTQDDCKFSNYFEYLSILSWLLQRSIATCIHIYIYILATKIQLLDCTLLKYLGCCLSIFYVTSQMHGTLSRNQNQLKTVGSVSFNCDEQLWCCSVDTSFYVYI